MSLEFNKRDGAVCILLNSHRRRWCKLRHERELVFTLANLKYSPSTRAVWRRNGMDHFNFNVVWVTDIAIAKGEQLQLWAVSKNSGGGSYLSKTQNPSNLYNKRFAILFLTGLYNYIGSRSIMFRNFISIFFSDTPGI